MSKYIRLEDTINAYNQAVKELVEAEMNQFDLCHFTECSFNTTQIMLIAQRIESLPTIEVSEMTGERVDEGKNELGFWTGIRKNVFGFWVGVCSKCGKENRVDNYCPNCGAEMEDY